MTISVIIPFYNANKTIKNTLQSIESQTLAPDEVIIIIDGCDSQYLKSITHEFNINIKLIELKNNLGASFARNIGINHAQGFFLAFLDSDDYWHPQKLEIQSKLMREKNINFSFHKYSELPFEIKKLDITNLEKINKNKFIYKQYIATPTVMVKRENFQLFTTKISHCEDYLCWMENTNKTIYYINENLAHGFKKQIGESGLSANIKKMHQGYIKSNVILLKKRKISLYFFTLSCIIEYIKYPFRYIKVLINTLTR